MNNSNSSTIILVIILFLFGIAIGVHLDSDIRMANDDLSFPINRELEVQEISDLRKANQNTIVRIQEVKKAVEKHEQEMISDNITLKKLRSEVNLYQLLAGHREAEGPGIIINLEGITEENIAEIVENYNYLVDMVNELKFFTAEVISINDHRLTSRSDIVKAGNHININGHPIPPPYQIKAIGDQRAFQRYVEKGTFIFEEMNSHGIRTNVLFDNNIRIPTVEREKPIELLKPIDET